MQQGAVDRYLINTQVMFNIAHGVFSGLVLLGGGENPSPQPQKDLPAFLEITWKCGPDLPQGLQDSDGGILGTKLVSIGGFCSGGLPEDNRRKPGRYPRGFLKKAWVLDLSERAAGWRGLPDFPGAARQGLFSAVVDVALFVWGGFSYDAPHAYADGWRLQRRRDRWAWDALPFLPWKVTSAGVCAIGSKIYACGGADYDGKAFYTEADRDGKVPRLGARLLRLDTRHVEEGWEELLACPGTPLWVHAVEAVSGKIYVIGGATGSTSRNGVNYGYCTVVDNWAFDPATETWSRRRNLPISSGNFPKSSNLVFRDRYIVLPGGHQYSYVANPDSTVRVKYGVASSKRQESGLHNDVFVYDTVTDLFGRATSLPIDNNLPMTVVRGDRIFLIGGETGGGFVDGEYYGHHPELFLEGKMALKEGR